MELPLGGPALRHYTQSRPRPHRQKLNYRPSRPQETIIESENEVHELIGRVDEGVEEFFTKKVLPTDTTDTTVTSKTQDEEPIIVHEVAPASSAPCPPQTKTLRRKLGDFFTLRKRRGMKSETSHEGRPKKASIADLIRPLREVARAEKEKDKDRVKEHDKENEKEKDQPSAVTGESVVQETPISGAALLRGEAVPPRRALREGKSQSLILLSGSAAAGTNHTRKKQFEGQHSFEQKLHLMLQRIGVSKAQQGEIQNPEREMKKAESEGTIIDSKSEPPATFTKPRTMSASSDTRHPIRPSVSAHESAGKPALLPKPVIKPSPGPATSGRNTPENELTQIQERESNTLTPTATPSVPSSPALSATTTSTVPTISSSAPDSTDLTISPSSTITPTDSDICTDSVSTTAAAAATTTVTKLDSVVSAPEVITATSELPISSLPTTLASTTTPTEPLAPVSVTSASSEHIALSHSVTFSSSTTSQPSITTATTVSAPSSESTVSTIATKQSAKSTPQESNGCLLVDVTTAASSDAAESLHSTLETVSSRTSDTPSDFTTSIPVTREDITSVSATSSSTVTSASFVTKTTIPPQNLSSTITTAVSADTLIASSSTPGSAALPPSNINISTSTPSPTPPACMDVMSNSSISHPATPCPASTSIPSTSSSETNPTDSTTTTNANLTAAATLITDSDPLHSSNSSTIVTSTISTLSATDNSSAVSHHLASPTPSHDRPGQATDSQAHPEEAPGPEPAVKTTSVKLEVGQKSMQAEKKHPEANVDDGKESEKPALADNEMTRETVQEESMKPKEVTLTRDAGVGDPASGKEGALYSAEEVVESHRQEETKSVDGK